MKSLLILLILWFDVINIKISLDRLALYIYTLNNILNNRRSVFAHILTLIFAPVFIKPVWMYYSCLKFENRNELF